MQVVPGWVEALAREYYAGHTCLFILHGNVHDYVWYEGQAWGLGSFLQQVVFRRRQIVLTYNRATGLSFRDEESQQAFMGYLRQEGYKGFPATLLEGMPLLHRFLQHGCAQGLRLALIIEYAESLIPQAPAGYYSAEERTALLYVLRWARDPLFLKADITILLLAESLGELHPKLVRNPHVSSISIPYPTQALRAAFIAKALEARPHIVEKAPFLTLQGGASALGGLTLVQIEKLLAEIDKSPAPWGEADLLARKKALVEAHAGGLLAFLSTPYTLDAVAGHAPVVAYFRQIVQLLKAGHTDVLPMGFLVIGPVGTGKTFLVRCLAGELGIPMVLLKNFRAPYVGQTESNLERIFALLEALSPVAVFVDEADTQLGQRSGERDGGVSQRVFGMIASFMSEPRHRGKILWFLATARPDLLPVDLKRQGRAEEHIPLFPPLTGPEKRAFVEQLLARAGFAMELPTESWEALPTFSGAEWESLLLRARFRALTLGRPSLTWEDFLAAIQDFIPPTYPEEIEYMTLLAVSECTRRTFLPPHYQQLSPAEIADRLLELRRRMR